MIGKFLKRLQSGEVTGRSLIEDDRNTAAAALLIEAGFADGEFSEQERDTVKDLLVGRLGLESDSADSMIEDVEKQVSESAEIWQFARIVKDEFDEEGRIGVIEMLWEVVLADGHIDDFEANLLRRIAGLLYVSDRDNGAARKRALARLQQ